MTSSEDIDFRPAIIYHDKDFYQVGCRNCGKGDSFTFFSDGESFILKCSCGHIINISEKNLRTEKDGLNN